MAEAVLDTENDRDAVAARQGPGPFRRYFYYFLILPVLGYALMFPLVMFPALGFDRWGGSKWAPVLDYSYHARHVDADTVIFGDSAAFLGIDPRLVDKEMGGRTIVLPNTFGSLQVTGDLALRRYLASNRPPRLIVFYFTPWDLNFQRLSRPEFAFEGEEMLLRNSSLRQIATFAMHHPRTFLRFPLQLNSLLDFHDIELALESDRGRMTAEAQGHMDYTDPIGPLPAHCELPADYLRPPDRAAIEAVMKRYETPQMHVLLYLAPLPSCVNAGVVEQEAVSGLGAPPPDTLPPTWFAADGMCAHVLPAHVAVSTQLLIDALRSRDAQERTGTGQGRAGAVGGPAGRAGL